MNDFPAPVFILFGGTGVVGSAMIDQLRARGLHILSVSIDPDHSAAFYDNLNLNLATTPAAQMIARLENALGANRPVVAALDIIGLRPDLAQALADMAKRRHFPVGVVSSCMVYAKTGNGPFDEDTPSLAVEQAQHPYQRGKLRQEQFWQNGAFGDWVIFRTNHILGRKSLLGCVPGHNRDPLLMDHLRQNRDLHLARGGNISLSYVHPLDFAGAVVHLMLDIRLRAVAVNVVHPRPVLALEYYAMLCALLGVTMPKVIPTEADANDFWSLTAQDNVFTSRHRAVKSWDFSRDIQTCLRDALDIGPDSYLQLGQYMRARIAGD